MPSSNQQSNIKNGAAVGFDAFSIIGTVVVANIIGFPEVEAAEGAAAPGLILMLTNTGGADAVAVGTLTGGIYGAVVGGTVGAALPTQSGCP